MWVERLLHVLSPVFDHKKMEGSILSWERCQCLLRSPTEEMNFMHMRLVLNNEW